MLSIDRNFLSLINVLSEQNFEWIASELLEGIQRGWEPMDERFEMDFRLQEARKDEPQRFFREMGDYSPGEPLQGIHQLQWGADYIYERIRETLYQILASLEALDKIVVSGGELHADAHETSAVLSFVDAEEGQQISQTQVTSALNHLLSLNNSLRSWMINAQLTPTEKMIEDVEKFLSQIVGSVGNLDNAAGAGRAFELYVMTGISLALRDRNFDVWIQQSDGQIVRPTGGKWKFVQRGGKPSHIESITQGPEKASSIVFGRYYYPLWELLNGIQFIGRSTAFHEIDIAVVPHYVVNSIRRLDGGGYLVGRPRVSIECKDVGTKGNPDEMRTFIARLIDLTLPYGYPQSTELRELIDQYALSEKIDWFSGRVLADNRRRLSVLARRSGFSSGTKPLADYYEVKRRGGITVRSYKFERLMNEVAEWICTNCL